VSTGEMSAPTDAELVALYGRCKSLTLAAGASLLLSRDAPEVRPEALALARDAGTFSDPSGRAALIQQAAQAVAALGDGSTDGDEALIQVRVAHRRLRTGLGALLASQYAPCGAHSYPKEENHG
jgi:hypothetical protein